MKNYAELGAILSRNDLKNIKGGYYCEIYFDDMVIGGECSGGSDEQCENYAQNNCDTYTQSCDQTCACSHSCW